MICFILIRHGDTLWTEEKRYQGRTDTPLSLIGRKKMIMLERIIQRVDVDVLYTSSLGRAKESGRIIAGSRRIKIKEDKRLNEISFGRWEGKTGQELWDEKDPVYKKWMEGRWVTALQGESIQSLRQRVKKFLTDCIRQYRSKTVVIVSHGGTIRMILIELLNLPLKHMFSFRIDPALVTVVKYYSNNTAQLVCLNTRDMEPAWILKK